MDITIKTKLNYILYATYQAAYIWARRANTHTHTHMRTPDCKQIDGMKPIMFHLYVH